MDLPKKELTEQKLALDFIGHVIQETQSAWTVIYKNYKDIY